MQVVVINMDKTQTILNHVYFEFNLRIYNALPFGFRCLCAWAVAISLRILWKLANVVMANVWQGLFHKDGRIWGEWREILANAGKDDRRDLMIMCEIYWWWTERGLLMRYWLSFTNAMHFVDFRIDICSWSKKREHFPTVCNSPWTTYINKFMWWACKNNWAGSTHKDRNRWMQNVKGMVCI